MDNQVDPTNNPSQETSAAELANSTSEETLRRTASNVSEEPRDGGRDEAGSEEVAIANSTSEAAGSEGAVASDSVPLSGSIMSNSTNVTKYSELTTKTIITSIVTCLAPLAILIFLIVSIFTSPDLNCAEPRCGYSWATYLTFLLINTPLSIACIIAQAITKNKFTQLTKIIDKPNTKVMTLARVSLIITILVLILPLAFHVFTSIGK
ncbi:MAG: hypothetical protein Q4E47_03045 [Candidatus Saccharibacteria bacterium]|nr:hypothetical protein [Candidatus Saccharibacteria bacterium]